MMALTLEAKVPRAVLTESRVGVVASLAVVVWAAASSGVVMAASANTAASWKQRMDEYEVTPLFKVTII